MFGRNAVECSNAGVVLIVFILYTEIEPNILIIGMDDRYVARNEYNASLGVVAGDRIFYITKLFFYPSPDLLVELGFAKIRLSGIGVADVVFGIERQPAVLCKCAGARREQCEKNQMFQVGS